MVELIRSAIIKLPTEFGEFNVFSYFEALDAPVSRATVLSKGNPTECIPLLRIQSACIFGDTFHGLTCDCRAQLSQAMISIQKDGCGLIIYLNQEEGRGVGLYYKTEAILLEQTQGLDTVEAFEKLGFRPDEREYSDVLYVLKDLHISQVRIITNSPQKIQALRNGGININKVVPLQISPSPLSLPELRVKQQKLHHDLDVLAKSDE